jgi:hypothetical protein
MPRIKIVSYDEAKNILNDKNIQSKSEYIERISVGDLKLYKLPEDPEKTYRGYFSWIDYLNIKGDFYTKEEAIKKSSEYIKLNPELKKFYLEITKVSKNLNKLDEKFPPSDFWLEYYKIYKYEDIIKIDISKKITKCVIQF